MARGADAASLPVGSAVMVAGWLCCAGRRGLGDVRGRGSRRSLRRDPGYAVGAELSFGWMAIIVLTGDGSARGELFIELEADDCAYYFVDHANRAQSWLGQINTYDLGLPPDLGSTQIGYYLFKDMSRPSSSSEPLNIRSRGKGPKTGAFWV
ncbi:hypothetical protein B0H11DRAFT_1938687 [Mycena galericulata]|nr:hypothetical protein B0H11DRAFT_1938687 [Mycena galericulata]